VFGNKGRKRVTTSIKNGQGEKHKGFVNCVGKWSYLPALRLMQSGNLGMSFVQILYPI